MKISEALEAYLDARDKWVRVAGSRHYEGQARRVMEITAERLDEALVERAKAAVAKRKGN